MRAIRAHGFTLLEMAIVLLVVALLLGGLLPTLTGRVEQQRSAEVRRQLEEIREALLGYAILYGRLPCPASSASNGEESFAAGASAVDGTCSNYYNGYLPAATLGLTTADGYLPDPWGNRIRYAVTAWNGNTYTKLNGMNSAGLANLAPGGAQYLQVCSSASGGTASVCAAGAALTANPGVPALIYSSGGNGSRGGGGADEAANPNPNGGSVDRVFVSHAPTAATSANGEFDDVLLWLSPAILFNRMVTAGKLP